VTGTHVWKLLLVLAGFAVLATPRGYAQSEIDPDHFDSPNTAPFLQSKTNVAVDAAMGKVRFSGKVNLPYSVRCTGKRLLPGHYTISLRSDGKTGRATLTQKGQTLEIAGVVRLPADTHGGNTVLVECIGKTHRLAAIHLEEMELVFAADTQVKHTSDTQPRRTENLLLTRTNPRK
jgi:hypothetical protein